MIDKVIYEDIPIIKGVKASSSVAIKKLIAYLAVSKIPTLNVSLLCTEIGVSRETLYDFLEILQRTDLLSIIRTKKSFVRAIKNSRILFYNPNIYYAIASEMWKHNTSLGNIRESFFVSQMKDLYTLFSSEVTDYLVDLGGKAFEFEIGGKSMSRKQIRDVQNGYVFKDDIEIGFENIIPLYLVGFVY